ncbi:hypothetical protein ACLMJK_001894 [Lecanora helva]
MQFSNTGRLLVCIPYFHALLVFATPLNLPAQPSLSQLNASINAFPALGADDPLHLPSTPQKSITKNGITVTFEDYGFTRIGISDTQSLLQDMWESYTHHTASQPIMHTLWELDYLTTGLIMNYVPGPRTTWGTFAIVTDILEEFWREWDRVSIFFSVASADGGQGYGEGFVATKEQYAEVVGSG